MHGIKSRDLVLSRRNVNETFYPTNFKCEGEVPAPKRIDSRMVVLNKQACMKIELKWCREGQGNNEPLLVNLSVQFRRSFVFFLPAYERNAPKFHIYS